MLRASLALGEGPLAAVRVPRRDRTRGRHRPWCRHRRGSRHFVYKQALIEEAVSHHALTPPRVLASEGEALDGAYRRAGVPDGALTGLAVSAGVAEGRARVVLDIAGADFVPADILVTVSTDPS